ncbi:MAG: RNA polymerase sigma factor [bacterium]|nr:RNA polymerase sigma factor [bacterium]
MNDNEKKKIVEVDEAYRLYYPDMYGFIYHRTYNRDDAKDLCQDLFFLLYNKFDEITTENKRTWLQGAARNLLSNYFRTRGMADTSDIHDVMEKLAFYNGERETRIIIDLAIDSIEDEEERQLLYLILYDEYTYQQAGNLLNKTERQIRYSFDKIKKVFIQKLKENGIKKFEDIL